MKSAKVLGTAASTKNTAENSSYFKKLIK